MVFAGWNFAQAPGDKGGKKSRRITTKLSSFRNSTFLSDQFDRGGNFRKRNTGGAKPLEPAFEGIENTF